MKRINEIIMAFLMILSMTLIPANADIRGQAANETSGENGYLNLSGGTVSWDPQNFAGFFYLPDFELGNEKLTILDTEFLIGTRTIPHDKLVYRTRGENKMLNVVIFPFNRNYSAAERSGLEQFQAGSMSPKNGSYRVVGWQGENYVAVKNRLNKLAKLIIEQGSNSTEKKTLAVGETWNIGGGWSLTINSIDAKATPRMASFTLSKDGVKKDDGTVTSGPVNSTPVYTYVEQTLAGESDVPVFVTYADAIFAGANTDYLQLRYTWAIDNNITLINPGERFGVFYTTNVNESGITLKNMDPVFLGYNSNVNLLGNISFTVADSGILRFYPAALSSPGAEVRGKIANETSGVKGYLDLSKGAVSWNPQNFAGFIYDINTEIGSEKLTVLHSNSLARTRTIYPKNLTYAVRGKNKMLNVVKYPFNGDYDSAEQAGLGGFRAGEMSSENGYYVFVPWQMEKYAGVMNHTNVLSRLLLEQDAQDRKTLTAGESWDIEGGYVLTVNSIDAKADPRQVWLTLSKDGVKLDDKILTQGQIYTYITKIAGQPGIPVFVTYIDSIFMGNTSDMVQLRYTWAIDSNFVIVKPGDRFGKLRTKVADGSHIVLENSVPLSLDRDSVTEIMGNLKFKVTGTDVLRFYPVSQNIQYP